MKKKKVSNEVTKNAKAMPRLLEMRAIPRCLLVPHPDAEAFGAEEEDRRALAGSVDECGLLDPLSVVRGEPVEDGAVNADGSPHLRENWLVIDGCGRLDATSAWGDAAQLPCMVFDLGDFSVREFALHRNTMQRKVTTGQRVLCYLQTNGPEDLGVSRDTRKEIASTIGCSEVDVAAARELMEEVEKDHAAAEEEALHEVFDDVLAGRTPIRRWKAALAGRTATKDKPKKPIDYKRICDSVCASLRTISKAWPGLKGALRDEIGEKLHDTLADAPSELRFDMGFQDTDWADGKE